MIALPLMTGRSPHITVYPGTGRGGAHGRDRAQPPGRRGRSGRSTSSSATGRSATSSEGRRAGASCSRVRRERGRPTWRRRWRSRPGVPFLFISASSMVSMFQGMTAYRIRSFFKALRKAARKEGGAIGFIEEIDAIAGSRDRVSQATPVAMDRSVSHFMGSAESGMVNELLIQMQSFDQPRLRTRMRGKFLAWLNGYLPTNWQFKMLGPEYHNLLLIAATNRADVARSGAPAAGSVRSPAVLRPADAGRARGPDRLLPRPEEAPRAAERRPRLERGSRTSASGTRP